MDKKEILQELGKLRAIINRDLIAIYETNRNTISLRLKELELKLYREIEDESRKSN